MENLNFDTGVQEYALGSGVLRFNPTDPNVYARFLEALEAVTALEASLAEQAQGLKGEAIIRLLRDTDTRVKEILGGVFGSGNDFSALLDGVNLMAVGSNGQRVITNLFAALEPVLSQGARRCARAEAQTL